MSDIAERFRKDTADHKMTVLHDDGIYRHLRFKAPGHGFYWFDIATWPGTLAFRGDVDGYMFTRITDMFEFFRPSRCDREINPHYWSEKVEGGRDITKSYSEALFREHVIDALKVAVQDGEVPRGLGKAIRTEILDDPDICSEDMARKLVESFEYGQVYQARCITCAAKSDQIEKWSAEGWETAHKDAHPKHVAYVATEPVFTFSDTWEWDLTDYDWSFLWACHAIVWGIAQYDQARQARLSARLRRALKNARRAGRKAVTA